LVWEAVHFKPATITTTIFRIGWHRSKGLELHTLNSRVVAQMPQAIRVFQGAKRVLFRQTRLSSPYPFFFKCLEAMLELKTLQPNMEDHCTIEAAWLVIGRFG